MTALIHQHGALAKTATFALVHFTVAFGVAYLLTGSVAISSALALVEPMVNTVAYYAHERIWRRFGSNQARRLRRRTTSPTMSNAGGLTPAAAAIAGSVESVPSTTR